MRIISQDGVFDMPYEQAVVAHLDEKVIAYPLYDLESTDYIQLASYSTEEKALKAMEMCRKRYAQCEFNKTVIPRIDANLVEISLDLTGKVINEYAEKYIFQFPANEEV